MSHYKVGVSNAKYDGKHNPTPRFIGPTVLLDYVAPKAALAYRKLQEEFRHNWHLVTRKFDEKYPLSNADSPEYREWNRLTRKPLCRHHLKKFARLIKRHLPK